GIARGVRVAGGMAVPPAPRGTDVLIITHGSLRLLPDQGTARMARAGEVVGLAEAVAGVPLPVQAVATVPTEALVISQAELAGAIEDDDLLCLELIRGMAAELSTEEIGREPGIDTRKGPSMLTSAVLGSRTHRKALELNLDPRTYGTFAEIGAGQEVARCFFQAGGASRTVAKSISAYDMAVSDSPYGPTQRYVSRQRLEAMLDREFQQLVESLGSVRGDRSTFFAFADTVATRKPEGDQHGRGWVGLRFQAEPRQPPSSLLLHVHLLDRDPLQQQEALGVLGVNLLHAAFFGREDLSRALESLLDDLSRERVEIDTLKVSGPAFVGVDNRIVSLQLVERRLTDAAMFTANGEVVQPSEVLYRKPILVERGSFRPATRLTLDLLERARERFVLEPEVRGKQPVGLAEMTLHSLVPGPDVGHADFLARADI